MANIFKKRGIGGHQRAYEGRTDEWLTPQSILQELGEFDLDPCSPINRPWPTANNHYTVQDDGLKQPWHGRVFLNPPYGSQLYTWMGKLAEHGNGIALIFARTETKTFFHHVWSKAHAILFIEGRLSFCYVNGLQSKVNSGGPSVLIAYGQENADVLKCCKIKGHYVQLKQEQPERPKELEMVDKIWDDMVKRSEEVRKSNQQMSKPSWIERLIPTSVG